MSFKAGGQIQIAVQNQKPAQSQAMNKQVKLG